MSKLQGPSKGGSSGDTPGSGRTECINTPELGFRRSGCVCSVDRFPVFKRVPTIGFQKGFYNRFSFSKGFLQNPTHGFQKGSWVLFGGTTIVCHPLIRWGRPWDGWWPVTPPKAVVWGRSIQCQVQEESERQHAAAIARKVQLASNG